MLNPDYFKHWNIKIIDQDQSQIFKMNQFDQIKPMVANGLRQLVNDINQIDRQQILQNAKILLQVMINIETVVNISFILNHQSLFTIKSFSDCKPIVIKNLITLVAIVTQLQQIKQPKWICKWQVLGSDQHPYLNASYQIYGYYQKKWKNVTINDHHLFALVVEISDQDLLTNATKIYYHRIAKWNQFLIKINAYYKKPVVINAYDHLIEINLNQDQQFVIDFDHFEQFDWKQLQLRKWWFVTTVKHF